MHRHVTRAALLAAASVIGLLSQSQVRATHINAPTTPAIRDKMTGEGYLEFQVNPAAGRYGEEWTGWEDIRHPVLDGTTSAASPYDWSNRFVNVRTIDVQDRNGASGGGDLTRDFDYANKIWMQAGMSVIHTESGTIKADGTGGLPNLLYTTGAPVYPNSGANDDVIKSKGRSADAKTINTYYIPKYSDTTSTGLTSGPAAFGANVPRNDGIGLSASTYVNNTFAHEVGHMILNGTAQHMEIAGDLNHSNDKTNLMWPDATQTATTLDQVGMLGRHDIVTSSQGLRVFGNLGNNNPNFVQRNAIDTTYANRVDFDFVTDHGQLSFTHNNTGDGSNITVTGGAENVGNNVDEQTPVGLDSLYFGINKNAPGHTVPATHNQTGMAPVADANYYKNLGNFQDQTFKFADVFSLTTRYSDYDSGATAADRLKNGALDYDVVFVDSNGAQAAGTPVLSYIPGWSSLTNADDYLTRWQAPFDAVGMYVFAHQGDGHDYTAQIDGIIVSNVPEPATLSVLGFGVLGLTIRRRNRN